MKVASLAGFTSIKLFSVINFQVLQMECLQKSSKRSLAKSVVISFINFIFTFSFQWWMLLGCAWEIWKNVFCAKMDTAVQIPTLEQNHNVYRISEHSVEVQQVPYLINSLVVFIIVKIKNAEINMELCINVMMQINLFLLN